MYNDDNSTRVKLARTHWQGWISMALIGATIFAIEQGQMEVATYLGLGAAGGISIQAILDFIVSRSIDRSE